MQAGAAAAVIIGNEVLTAKVTEANGSWLIKKLRERAIPLVDVHLVLDEVDAIVEAVCLARRRAQWVFTSGGVGPTHDDVTVRAVALALGRPVVRLREMESLVREHYGDALKPEAMRLADAPQGSELWQQPGHPYPVLTCDGVFLLPGVPQLFRMQLNTVLARLPAGRLASRVLYLSSSEAEIAAVLDAVALAMPHVAIGSYPLFDADADYRVKLTVEHNDEAPVLEALRRLEATLPPGSILRRE